MRLRSTELSATAFVALGALLGYGAASADLFRNAVASATTEQLATGRGSKPTLSSADDFDKGFVVAQTDQLQTIPQKPSSGKKPNVVFILADKGRIRGHSTLCPP